MKLDAYLPARTNKPAPVVVWIHGGGWVGGDKRACPARLLAPDGYAAFSINYRLATEAPWPAQIRDCKAAIRWLRANAAALGIDPDRIGVWGASAGGHLAALLGTTAGDKELEGDGGNAGFSSSVQAVCDWFGPTDLARIVLARARADARAAGPVMKLLGDPKSNLAQVAQQASPISHVSKGDAPCLIMHGDRDTLVPLEQSRLFHEALTKAGVESTLHVVKGAGHGFAGKDVAAMVKQFFDKHLKDAEADKDVEEE